MFYLFYVYAVLTSYVLFVNADLPCFPKTLSAGKIVCVCTETYCDEIQEPDLSQLNGGYFHYVSNKQGLRFSKQIGGFSYSRTFLTLSKSLNEIVIDPNQAYQEINGFGGALTDSAAINAFSLTNGTKDRLLKSYFDKNGIEYSLVRIPIGGTDFSTHGYSYDDGNPDPNLTNYKLAPEDFKYKLPFLRQIKALSGDNKVKFFTSVWTAPKWMKTNGDYNGIGFLKHEYYASWAKYIMKFFELYKENGIDFWALTTQNEPSLAFIPKFISKISSIAWIPSQMIEFVTKHLGPALRKSEFANLKLMCFDDQRIFMDYTVNKLFESPDFLKYVDGIAYHWYQNKLSSPSILDDMHKKYPSKFILMTEACVGDKPWEKKVDLGSWDRGEEYMSDIIENMNHWVTGWVDWNMALDLKGGPTWIDNNVDSPILVNSSANEFYKQPMFYALGHFSKFVKPESKRIKIETYLEGKIATTAFKRKDGAIIIQIINKNNKDVNVQIRDKSRKGTINALLTRRSFNTIIYL